jgi:organic radical activating enzyme
MLAINEIFTSISGEVGHIPQGTPITVLRLQHCNLDCPWCDAPDSKSDKSYIDAEHTSIAETLVNYGKPVLITGGEPLLQSEALIKMIEYMDSISEPPLKIQIETNGTQIVNSFFYKRVGLVTDFKIAYEHKMEFSEFLLHKKKDWVKILVTSITEIERFVEVVKILKTQGCCGNIAVSSIAMSIYPFIYEAISENDLDVVINVQIHKMLNLK